MTDGYIIVSLILCRKLWDKLEATLHHCAFVIYHENVMTRTCWYVLSLAISQTVNWWPECMILEWTCATWASLDDIEGCLIVGHCLLTKLKLFKTIVTTCIAYALITIKLFHNIMSLCKRFLNFSAKFNVNFLLIKHLEIAKQTLQAY